MSNKTIILLLSIITIIGLVFLYYQEDSQKTKEDMDTNYNMDKTEETSTDTGYGVSASHPLAVKAGMKILEQGGNAADAAVTVSYVLNVVEPYGSGIGGGGEMLVDSGDQDDPVAYQYREKAPSSISDSQKTAVPGMVLGMKEINQDLGSMDMDKLIQPAIDYAEEGFKADKTLVHRLDKGAHRMEVDELSQFFPDGDAIDVNDTIKQLELGKTLKDIQEKGASSFYTGDIADSILDHNENLKEEDLSNYRVEKKNPVHGQFAGYDVYSAPPPLAGITLIQSLRLAEKLDLPSHKENQSDYINLMSEITQETYDDRLQNIGDDHFVSTKANGILTSDEYIEDMANAISSSRSSDDNDTHESSSDGNDHTNTTHFEVVDKDGTMISATNTLGNFFGSGDNVDGFFMNSSMDSFSESDDSINSAETGKTPRSFTAPTILKNENRTIGIGSPGGRRIPMILTEMLSNHLLLNESLDDAIEAPRFYTEDNDIMTENELNADIKSGLRSKGYDVYQKQDAEYYGSIQALVLDKNSNSIYGSADERRNGTWKANDNKKKE